MSNTMNPLRAVFALPPGDAEAEAFAAWWSKEVRRLLLTEGVASARLYGLTPYRREGSPAGYTHCALMEIDGDPAQTFGRLDSAMVSGSRPEYAERTRFATYDLTAIDEFRPEHTLDAAQLYLVFSAPPAGVSPQRYDRWYHAHIRENVEIGGLTSAHRWDPVASGIDPELPPHATHVASYALTAGADAMSRLLDAAIADGRIVLPSYFDGITFASAQITATTERMFAA